MEELNKKKNARNAFIDVISAAFTIPLKLNPIAGTFFSLTISNLLKKSFNKLEGDHTFPYIDAIGKLIEIKLKDFPKALEVAVRLK